MRLATIHQPQYLPYMGFLAKVDASDIFVLYDIADCQTRNFVHRNRIMTKDGIAWLTIPVHGHQKKPIRDIEIDGTAWKDKHLKTVKHAYGKSELFDKYFPGYKMALSIRSKWLLDYDIATMLWLFDSFGIYPKFLVASELWDVSGFSSGMKLAILSQKSGADSYLAGPAWRDYMDNTSEFDKCGVDFYEALIDCDEYNGFRGNEKNLSSMDLLFSSL